MGKLIDVNKWFKDTFPKADLDYPILDNKKAYPHWSIDITGLAYILNDAESVEAIPKDQYETRLKADMVTMLEELKKSIEDKVYNVSAYSECLDCDVVDYEDVNEIVIEKINALRGQNNGQDR